MKCQDFSLAKKLKADLISRIKLAIPSIEVISMDAREMPMADNRILSAVSEIVPGCHKMGLSGSLDEDQEFELAGTHLFESAVVMIGEKIRGQEAQVVGIYQIVICHTTNPVDYGPILKMRVSYAVAS